MRIAMLVLAVVGCSGKPPPATKCADKIDQMFAAHDAYFAATGRIRWTADCATVLADLHAAESAAVTFSKDRRAADQALRADGCIEEASTDPRAATIATRYEKLFAAAMPADERCSDQVAGWRTSFDGVIGATGAAL